ncbi:MAG: hypothetical protein OXH77_03905 [Anaerolineaceae bacterium]|nr:hypothetical protein [Anaerolineaceae bacterium]
MTDVLLSQSQADRLFAMEKFCENRDKILLPNRGQKDAIILQSKDKKEEFFLDLYRGNVALHKVMFQNRARQSVVLARLDLVGGPHRNPNGKVIPTPHLHYYREGFGSKCAKPIPSEHFRSIDDVWKTFWDFIRYCNIKELPEVQNALRV